MFALLISVAIEAIVVPVNDTELPLIVNVSFCVNVTFVFVPWIVGFDVTHAPSPDSELAEPTCTQVFDLVL